MVFRLVAYSINELRYRVTRVIFLNSHSEVNSKLGPLGTSATSVLSYLHRVSVRNEDWQGKPKSTEETCPNATLSTKNSTLPDPGANPSRRGGMPATNRLSYDAFEPSDLLKFGK
jgi:hypothetical protein